jgi:hypothetical protein
MSIWLFSNLNSQTPHWVQFGLQNTASSDVYSLFYDTLTSTLYCGGQFQYLGGKNCRGAAKWNGTDWDTMGVGFDYYVNPTGFTGTVTKILRYKNYIYYFGAIDQAGKYHTGGMALWNGSAWDSVGYFPNGYVYDADVYNDTLYICGSFSKIGSLNSNCAAKFDGTNWYPMSFPYPADCPITHIKAFKNKVYGSGGFYNNGFSILAEWTQANGWKPSFGFQGTTAKTLFGMERIDSLLFFYGRFTHISTLFTPCIAAWSGTHLYGFGQGVGLTSYSDIERIKNFKGENKIMVVGSFDNAGGMMLNPGVGLMVAELYSNKWCIYGDTLDNTITDIEKYNGDNLICGGVWKINRDSIKKVAKWIGGSYTYSCNNFSMSNLAIGVDELMQNNNIRLFPNPVSNKLYISSDVPFENATEIEIINTLGQTVLKLNYTNEIDVSTLSQGYYTLKIISPDKRQFHSKFLKE